MTEQEYAANVARRFGNGNLPSWADLAKRENRAMLRLVRHAPPVAGKSKRKAEKPSKPESVRVEEFRRTRVEGIRAYAAQRRNLFRGWILEKLAQPKTISDLTKEVNMCRSGIARHLEGMMADGLVDRVFRKRGCIWHRVQEAAE